MNNKNELMNKYAEMLKICKKAKFDTICSNFF